MTRLLLILTLLLTPFFAAAEEEIVLGLSQDKVAITAQFDGSDILIFGAVKREVAIPDNDLDVIIAIEGPTGPMVVRRKEKKFGIWINGAALEVDKAPAFYAVASSAPLADILRRIENERYLITVDKAIQSVSATVQFGNTQAFTEALMRIQANNGSYQLLEEAVEVDQQTLFRSSISLPSNLTEGDYNARIFLVRNGHVVADLETVIDVRKVGLERFLYNLAQEQAPIYGLLSILMAIAAGWGASALFRLIRDG
ncbi:MAG: TIGR02186 family protein [Pseudomonadota bacterium]|nr:TIGR02186 family protein [Pseudomonadota bacterium]